MSVPSATGVRVLAIDVDGVLVHPNPDLGGGAWDSRIDQDLGIDPRELGSKFFRTYWSEVVVGRRDLRETLAAVMPSLNPSVSADEFISYWFANDGHLDELVAAELRKWRERPGAITAAVTNQEKMRVAHLRQRLGFDELFDHIVWSGDLGITKSSPEFYIRAQEIFGVKPHEIVFFDDDQPNVDLANAAGWRAFHFQSIATISDALSTVFG